MVRETKELDFATQYNITKRTRTHTSLASDGFRLSLSSVCQSGASGSGSRTSYDSTSTTRGTSSRTTGATLLLESCHGRYSTILRIYRCRCALCRFVVGILERFVLMSQAFLLVSMISPMYVAVVTVSGRHQSIPGTF